MSNLETQSQGVKRKRLSSLQEYDNNLSICIVGFGYFGQFLAKTFCQYTESLIAVSRSNVSDAAVSIGARYVALDDNVNLATIDCDIVLIAVSIISFEEVLNKLPKDLLKGKLIVDVLSVKVHARDSMLSALPADCDILCTHPMFGPESGKFGWQGLPFLFDKVRIQDSNRCDRFLSIWEGERCKMIEMSCEHHDEYAANSQFITHFIGRSLKNMNLTSTPIDTKSFEMLINVVDSVCKNSQELFHGLYIHNHITKSIIQKLKESIIKLEDSLEEQSRAVSSLSK